MQQYKTFCKNVCKFNNAIDIFNYILNIVKLEYNIKDKEFKVNNFPEKITKKSFNAFLENFINDNKNDFNNDILLAIVDYIYKAGHCLSTLKNNISLSLSDFIVDDDIINKFEEELKHAKTLLDKDAVLKKYLPLAKENLKQKDSKFLHIIETGARASESQLKQMTLARGLIDTGFGTEFVASAYIRGLNLKDFETSALAARKALYDKTISTAKPGYLTRQLIYALSHLNITEDDCGTKNYFIYKVTEENHKSFKGKYYYNTETKQEELITDTTKFINKTIYARSALFCQAKHLCRKCVGEYHYPFKELGIIAAQTLGERATQLTLRVFHTGSAVDFESELNVIAKEYPEHISFEHNKLKVLKNTKLILPADVIIASNSNMFMNDIKAMLEFEDNVKIDLNISQGSKLLYTKINNIPADIEIIQITPITITNAITVVENFLRKKIILNNEAQFMQYLKIITKLFSYETTFPAFMYELLALSMLTDTNDIPVSVSKKITFPLIKQPLKVMPHLLGIGFLFETPRIAAKKRVLSKISVDSPLKKILFI